MLLSDTSVVGIALKLIKKLLKFMKGFLMVLYLQGRRTQQLRFNGLKNYHVPNMPVNAPPNPILPVSGLDVQSVADGV